ncbi:deoxyribodipyrimidine photo-lyase [Imbroritus primus]|uniref:Deoxyribodipyrimidine photo-lyase n=1 Tax=Imbroritus primus TaxID=3058603 RepID=A0ACD3SSA4_9BURK|nr:deoxyribodipyrimidine photo-lyase [Burkholderiaceae bacterium PBA]
MPARRAPDDSRTASAAQPAGCSQPSHPFRRGLVWFRRDLRCVDHAALHHALAQCETVLCVFVFDPDLLEPLARAPDRAGHRRVAFLHGCVAALDAALAVSGNRLIVQHGRAVESLASLVETLGIDALFYNRDYEPAAIARDEAVTARLQALSCVCFDFKDQVIFERGEVLTAQGQPFSVFTPYKNAWLRRLTPADLAPRDVVLRAAPAAEPTAAATMPTLAQLGFDAAPETPPLAPGSAAAEALLDDFLARLDDYHVRRDFPAVRGPSYLSAHLRFGTVSIRTLAACAHQRMLAGSRGAETWLSELIWREFYMMILAHHPRVAAGESFKPEYDRIRWAEGTAAEEAFAAWCAGRTGYPLVDAAMLQLNTTGYMHNRLRMVTASFLCKDLGIDWRRGEAYFAARLTDHDFAANNGGWQWASSSGCDAQPYFRIFNPVTQSTRFDPQGKFIRRYLPQLAKLPDRDIHAPWAASATVLAEAGVKLGKDYPYPLVDHAEARQQTLERYQVVKATSGPPQEAKRPVRNSGKHAGSSQG